MAESFLLYSREEVKFVYNHLRNRVNEFRNLTNYDPSAEWAIVQGLRAGQGDPEVIRKLSLKDGSNPFLQVCERVLEKKELNPVEEWLNIFGPYLCDTYTLIGSYNSSYYVQYMCETMMSMISQDPKCTFWGVSYNIDNEMRSWQPLSNNKLSEALILDDSIIIRIVVPPEGDNLFELDLNKYTKQSRNNYVIITADMDVICANFDISSEEISKLQEYVDKGYQGFDKKYDSKFPGLADKLFRIYDGIPEQLEFWRVNLEREYSDVKDRLRQVSKESDRRKIVRKVQDKYCKPDLTDDQILRFIDGAWSVHEDNWGVWGELAQYAAYMKLEGLSDKKTKLKYLLLSGKPTYSSFKAVFKDVFIQLLRDSRSISLDDFEQEALALPSMDLKNDSSLINKITNEKNNGVVKNGSK